MVHKWEVGLHLDLGIIRRDLGSTRRAHVFSVKIAEGGRGVRAILTSLSWKNIVKLWSDP